MSAADYATRARAWAERVVAEEEPAGPLVKLACERQLADLERQGWWPYTFDAEEANLICAFVERMPHIKGRWARDRLRIELEDWQCFHLTTFFGWRREDGGRRYRESFEEVARKNAKSTKAAPIGLYLLAADNEPGAEIYSAATTRDQARIIFGIANAMARQTRPFTDFYRVEVGKHSIHSLHDESWFRPVSADAHTLEGLNVHGALIDETHVHQTSLVIDVLRTAMGSREQPVLWQTTTAGVWDTQSPYVREHNYVRQVLEGTIDDEQVFGFIAAGSRDDDWEDPVNLARANPNLDVSVRLDYLQSLARKARKDPSFVNEFLRKHLNVPTNQVDRWITMDLWDANAGETFEDADLVGLPCWGGIDISTSQDFSAWVLIFLAGNGQVIVRTRLWLPEDGLAARRDAGPGAIARWAVEGWIETTEGEAVDHDVIEAAVAEDCRAFKPRLVGYDPWNMAATAGRLDKAHVPMVKMRQGYGTFSESMRELEALLVKRKIAHGGHPVLRWMANNVAIRETSDGFRKPDKGASAARIDGVVALLMAVAGWIAKPKSKSVYEDRGVLLI